MENFVENNSIVRQIWGKSETVLFVFAGAAAEFALNKAVDWLYFTRKIPNDPLGRLFATASYAKKIIFSPYSQAIQAIDGIMAIHHKVEKDRDATIPGWAYRDVLYMLIHYSIASFGILERKLTAEEKEEVLEVFNRLGVRMEIPDLAQDYNSWKIQREADMERDMAKSDLTVDLFAQYKKHLGKIRYAVLIESQILVVPERVRQLLGYSKYSMLRPFIPVYKFSRKLHLDKAIKSLILPSEYKQEISELDVAL